jgi:hypothetical protein
MRVEGPMWTVKGTFSGISMRMVDPLMEVTTPARPWRVMTPMRGGGCAWLPFVWATAMAANNPRERWVAAMLIRPRVIVRVFMDFHRTAGTG